MKRFKRHPQAPAIDVAQIWIFRQKWKRSKSLWTLPPFLVSTTYPSTSKRGTRRVSWTQECHCPLRFPAHKRLSSTFFWRPKENQSNRFLSLRPRMTSLSQSNRALIEEERQKGTLRRIHFFACRDPEEGPDLLILMQLMYSKNFRTIDVLKHSSYCTWEMAHP